jgi:hypothetical protein
MRRSDDGLNTYDKAPIFKRYTFAFEVRGKRTNFCKTCYVRKDGLDGWEGSVSKCEFSSEEYDYYVLGAGELSLEVYFQKVSDKFFVSNIETLEDEYLYDLDELPYELL